MTFDPSDCRIVWQRRKAWAGAPLVIQAARCLISALEESELAEPWLMALARLLAERAILGLLARPILKLIGYPLIYPSVRDMGRVAEGEIAAAPHAANPTRGAEVAFRRRLVRKITLQPRERCTPTVICIFPDSRNQRRASRGDRLRSIAFQRPSTGLSDPDAADRLAAILEVLALNSCKTSTDEPR